MLQKLVADRTVNPLNGTAFAVTHALRESYSDGDEDELAEVALREAALASLRLLAAAADEGRSSDVVGEAAPAARPELRISPRTSNGPRSRPSTKPISETRTPS